MQLLSKKTKTDMSQPGMFQKEDMYCLKHLRWAQCVCNEFWIQWRKEGFTILHSHQKWNCPIRNFQAGHEVLVWKDSRRNKWPMTKFVKAYPNRKEFA